MSLARTTMADNIVTLLQASTKTELAKLDNNAIQFGTRKFESIFAVTWKTGILVTLGGGTVEMENIGGSKEDVQQDIEIVIYQLGYDPAADQKLVSAILEEVEEVLRANLTLSGGGTLMSGRTLNFLPPVARGSLVLHWAVLIVKYRKTGT
jgi:hypothetical protein